MGFHLVTRVYENVRGTSPKAQAVLAFLAHRADDKGIRKCFPDAVAIEEATHFGHTAVRDALNELREANLLAWKSGGRHKGAGGRSLANEYTFNLPVDKPKNVNKSLAGRDRETATASAATRTLQGPRDGLCIDRPAATINPYQDKNQPSLNGGTEAETAKMKGMYVTVAEEWTPENPSVPERVVLKERLHRSLIDEAMAAAGVSDSQNKRVFSSTLLRRNPDDCREVIYEFACQRRANPDAKLVNPAAVLNSLLARLPLVC